MTATGWTNSAMTKLGRNGDPYGKIDEAASTSVAGKSIEWIGERCTENRGAPDPVADRAAGERAGGD